MSRIAGVHFDLIGDDDEALEAAKQIGIDSLPMTHLTIASAAGQAGVAWDARGAIEALHRVDPAWLSAQGRPMLAQDGELLLVYGLPKSPRAPHDRRGRRD